MRISRMELYEKIWSTGTSKTATELNVPYDKLKSACTEHSIPLPSLKYWGLLHKGKETPEKTPLLHPEQNDEIIIVANKGKTIAPTEEATPKSLPKSKVNAQIAAENPYHSNQITLIIFLVRSKKVSWKLITHSK